MKISSLWPATAEVGIVTLFVTYLWVLVLQVVPLRIELIGPAVYLLISLFFLVLDLIDDRRFFVFFVKLLFAIATIVPAVAICLIIG